MTPPNIFKRKRKLVKKLAMLQESSSQYSLVFSVTSLATIVGQMVERPPPPNGKCLGTSLLAMHNKLER